MICMVLTLEGDDFHFRSAEGNDSRTDEARRKGDAAAQAGGDPHSHLTASLLPRSLLLWLGNRVLSIVDGSINFLGE